MGIVGLGLTGLGTWLAIAPPTLQLKWNTKNAWWLQRNRQAYYYAGIVLITVGTILQMAEGLKAG